MPHVRTTRWLVAFAVAALVALVLPVQAGAQHRALDPQATSPAVARVMSEAMRRDLGLTVEQARGRLEAEDAAARLDAVVATELGAAFAGSWYDADLGRLVVASTSAAGAERARALGADAVTAERSAAQLSTTKQRLDALAGDAAPAAITSWHVDVRTNSVVVTADPRRLDGASAALLDAARAMPGVRVVDAAEAPRPAYNVVGGHAFYIGNSRCSIGFSTRTAGGAKAFVTAGHCTAGGGGVIGANGVRMGSASGSTFGAGGDFGRVSVTSDRWELRPWVSLYDGRALIVQGSDPAPVGASVCRSGSTSGWRCGEIKAKDVTVNYPGRTVHGLVRSSACASPGDSGGPFMHNGQAQGLTSGITAQCGSGELTDSFYQPVREALNAYNMHLVTG